MAINLYVTTGSPPCLIVKLVARAVGVQLNLIELDFSKNEQLSPEFIKLNPTHTVPTMDDNGLILYESRAIITYLVEKYAKNDSLYPKDINKRSVVDQRLYFDIGTLYSRFFDYYYPAVATGVKLDLAKLPKTKDALKFLDTFLEKSNFVAGNQLTVADFSIVVSIECFEASNFGLTPYKNVTRWFAKIKDAIPDYKKIGGTDTTAFKAWFDNMEKE